MRTKGEKGRYKQVIALEEVKRSWEKGAFNHVRKIRTPRYDNRPRECGSEKFPDVGQFDHVFDELFFFAEHSRVGQVRFP